MKYFCVIILVLPAFLKVQANDVEAQEKCKSIHHTDVDLQNTEYLNHKCLLNCNIHNRIWTHMMNEDMQCPGFGAKGVRKGLYIFLMEPYLCFFVSGLQKWQLCTRKVNTISDLSAKFSSWFYRH